MNKTQLNNQIYENKGVYGDKEKLEKEYSIPLNVKAIATLKELFRSPAKTTLYFGIRLYTR